MSREPAYREELLHWVWETSRMDLNRLKSIEGQPIFIYDTGSYNQSDGPDFLNAHIQIGDLSWFGDVEIHWKPEDWNHHGHDTNPSFNKVVLHVVWEKGNRNAKEILRPDGTSIPTLLLKNVCHRSLSSFLDQYHKPSPLPCANHFTYLSEDAFLQQIEKAERQYFEQKVNDLLSFWDPSLPPSKAWLKLVAMGLFDGLGISHNRKPMRRLLQQIYPQLSSLNSRSQLIERAGSLLQEQLRASDKAKGAYAWSHKGSRPANHPEVRVPQAAACLWYLQQLPFASYLRNDPKELWGEMNQQLMTEPGLGEQRKSILFGTVWLPAFFILGSTFGRKDLKEPVFDRWRHQRVPLPSAITRPFESLNLAGRDYKHSLGTVHQLRAYCRPRHCNRCKVFKSVISS